MENTPLAAVHGAEVEGRMCFLNALRSRHRAHPQFLDAQHTMVVRIEAQQRVLFRSHTQCFDGQLLHCQQQFRLISEQKIHVLAAETHQDIRILEIGMQRFSGRHGVGQRKSRTINDQFQELPYARLSVRKR